MHATRAHALLGVVHQGLSELGELGRKRRASQFTGRGQHGRSPGIIDFADLRLERQLGKQRHIISERAGQLFADTLSTAVSENLQPLALVLEIAHILNDPSHFHRHLQGDQT